MRFQRELLKGTTETLILAVLRDAPSHGYKLVERLRQRSEGIFELGEGTLYPLLYKLEDKGLISGKWEAGSGERRKRVYHITPPHIELDNVLILHQKARPGRRPSATNFRTQATSACTRVLDKRP